MAQVTRGCAPAFFIILLVVLSVCVIVANLIMDLLNFVLDPRLRTS